MGSLSRWRHRTTFNPPFLALSPDCGERIVSPHTPSLPPWVPPGCVSCIHFLPWDGCHRDDGGGGGVASRVMGGDGCCGGGCGLGCLRLMAHLLQQKRQVNTWGVFGSFVFVFAFSEQSDSCEGKSSAWVLCYVLARGQSHMVSLTQAYPSQREGHCLLLPIPQSRLPGISHAFNAKAKPREKHKY